MTQEQFGARIKRLRVKLGLNQLELNAQCELSSGYIGSLEKGNINPTLETLTRIASAINVSLSELLGEEDPIMNGYDASTNKLIAYALPLKPETRIVLSKLARMLADVEKN